MVEFEQEMVVFCQIQGQQDFDLVVEFWILVVVCDRCVVGRCEKIGVFSVLSKTFIDVEYTLEKEILNLITDLIKFQFQIINKRKLMII